MFRGGWRTEGNYALDRLSFKASVLTNGIKVRSQATNEITKYCLPLSRPKRDPYVSNPTS